MGYILAAMMSGVQSTVFLTDSPGDGHGKTEGSPPQLDSNGGSFLEMGESSTHSPRLMPQSIPK